MRFGDMNLSEYLCGFYASGFEKSSAIQQRANLPCVKGYAVIAQAHSGTGTAATFAVSVLQQIELHVKATQGFCSGIHSWTGSADTKHSSDTKRLHGYLLSCLFGERQCTCLGAGAVDGSSPV